MHSAATRIDAVEALFMRGFTTHSLHRLDTSEARPALPPGQLLRTVKRPKTLPRVCLTVATLSDNTDCKVKS